jgi:hypothetical protein
MFFFFQKTNVQLMKLKAHVGQSGAVLPELVMVSGLYALFRKNALLSVFLSIYFERHEITS